jgi:hypothetical protein
MDEYTGFRREARQVVWGFNLAEIYDNLNAVGTVDNVEEEELPTMPRLRFYPAKQPDGRSDRFAIYFGYKKCLKPVIVSNDMTGWFWDAMLLSLKVTRAKRSQILEVERFTDKK